MSNFSTKREQAYQDAKRFLSESVTTGTVIPVNGLEVPFEDDERGEYALGVTGVSFGDLNSWPAASGVRVHLSRGTIISLNHADMRAGKDFVCHLADAVRPALKR